MKACEPSAHVPPTSSVGSEPCELNPIRNFTGTYYRILGWIGVASIIVSIATAFWTDFIHFDLSFVLWFWLGRCLKEGNPTARKWAIAQPLIFLPILVIGFFTTKMKVSFGGLQFNSSELAYYLIATLIVVIFGIPGLVLMTKKGRAVFTNKEDGEQDMNSNPH